MMNSALRRVWLMSATLLVAPTAHGESPPKAAYFGDLHVHTKISVDSFLQRAMLTMDDAYRFAQGGTVVTPGGQQARLARPLDFVALTDHAENFATFDLCIEGSGPASRTASCQLAKEQRGTGTYVALGNLHSPENCGGDARLCAEATRRTWRSIRDLADRNYRPGTFTTLIGYEYSGAGGPGGYAWHNHRNLIFSSSVVPDTVFSALDSNLNTDLWAWLEKHCTGPCDVVSIPHNSNLSSGVAFALETIEGRRYTTEEWRRRARYERLVEVYQAKGDSECQVGFGTSDEQCGLESFLPTTPACPPGQAAEERGRCVAESSFVRNALKRGLALLSELGFNPFQFGLVGSTDTHNAMPGSTESANYHGWRGAVDGTPRARLQPSNVTSNPGGLTGVWAPENTREAIFAALKAREVFATSGTRIELQVFGGWRMPADAHARPDFVRAGYRDAVPMGQEFRRRPRGATAPALAMRVRRAPDGAPLHRLQVVKGWLARDGQVAERVFDVACSDGMVPDPTSGSCPDNGASVDLGTCTVSDRSGAGELATTWRDPDFRPEQPAFYYVRVLENPSCRWSTWESLRAGMPLSPAVPPTVRQRAWSSPIWYSPAGPSRPRH